jgi:pilus assembly protein CpaB
MLIFGVVLAAVSFVVVLAFGSFNQPQAPATVAEVPVVVASQNLGLGTSLTAEMLSTVNRAPAEATDTYQHPEDLVGLVVRRAVTQGAALTTGDFQTDSNLPEVTGSLPSGLVAIAIPLSRVDSVGDLLQPGDWVDAILTLEDLDGLNPIVIPAPSTSPVGTDGGSTAPYISLDDFMNNTTVKVVVQKVQVLATLAPIVSADSNTISTTGAIQPDVIVVLAVTPQQSEVVRFAQLDGHVSLVLRSPSDSAAEDVPTTGITLRELLDRWGVLPPQPVVPVTP